MPLENNYNVISEGENSSVPTLSDMSLEVVIIQKWLFIDLYWAYTFLGRMKVPAGYFMSN